MYPNDHKTGSSTIRIYDDDKVRLDELRMKLMEKEPDLCGLTISNAYLIHRMLDTVLK